MSYCRWITLVCFLIYWATSPGTCTTLLGGVQPLDGSELQGPEFQEVVQHAVRKFNTESNPKNWHTALTMSNAFKQVVSGIMYKFNLRLSPTNCSVSAVLSSPESYAMASQCSVLNDTHTFVCDTEVWLRPWMQGTGNGTQTEFKGCWRVGPALGPIERRHKNVEAPIKPLPSNVKTVGTLPTTADKAAIAINQQISRAKVVKVVHLMQIITHGAKVSTADQQEYQAMIQLTNCTGPLSSIDQLKAMKEEKCYLESTSEPEKCEFTEKIRKDKPSHELSSITVRGCAPEPHRMFGMWRLAAVRNDGEIKFQQSNKAWQVTDLPLVATVVELPMKVGTQLCPRIERFRQEAVVKFNQMSNSAMAYVGAVYSDASQLYSPELSITFEMVFYPTKALKRNVNLKDIAPLSVQEVNEKYQSVSNKMFVKPSPNIKAVVEIDDVESNTPVLRISGMETMLGLGLPPRMLGAAGPITDEDRHNGSFKGVSQLVKDRFNQLMPTRGEAYMISEMSNIAHQVVAGSLYTMDVTFVPTSCERMNNCELWVRCTVEVSIQPWSEPKETVGIDKCYKVTTERPSLHVARTMKVKSSGSGDPKITQLIEQSLKAFNKQKSTAFKEGYATDIQQMVGSGVLMQFKLHVKTPASNTTDRTVCNVFAKGPLSGPATYISVHDCHDKPKRKQMTKPAIAGAPQEMDQQEVYSTEFYQLIARASDKQNAMSNEPLHYIPRHIGKPKVQVVAGSMTTFELHSQATSCDKKRHATQIEEKAFEKCGPINQTHMLRCEVSVHAQPWIGQESIKIAKCRSKPMLSMPTSNKMIDLDIVKQHMIDDAIDRAVLVYNDISKAHNVYYERSFVENLTHQVKNDTWYKFTLTMKPTGCVKGQHDDLYGSKNMASCQAKEYKNVVRCDVIYKESRVGPHNASIELQHCRQVEHAIQLRLPTATMKPHLLDEVVQKSAKLALDVLDEKLNSPFVHQTYQTDKVHSQNNVGQVTTFDLHVKPVGCANRDPTVPSSDCKIKFKLYSLHCKVKAWNRPWLNTSNAVQVSNCQLTQSGHNKIMLGAPGKPTTNLQDEPVAQEQLRELVNMFNREVKPSEPYELEMIQNVTDQMVAGRMLKFDMTLRPNGTLPPMSAAPYYHCVASIWLRPWLNTSTVLKLTECRSIENDAIGPKPIPMLANRSTLDKMDEFKLEQIKNKTTVLFNGMHDDGFLYGIENFTKVGEDRTSSLKYKFSAVYTPIACARNAKTQCRDVTQMPKYHCDVEVTEQAWLEARQQVALKNCYSVSQFRSRKPGTKPLSPQEMLSPDFRKSLDVLRNTYDPNSPVIYEADRIENGVVKQSPDGNHTITFDMTLKSVGCNQSKESMNPVQCREWASQDPIKCQASVSETAGPVIYQSYRLHNCQLDWKQIEKRPLSPTELLSSRIRDIITKGVAMHSKMVNRPELFKVDKIEGGKIERSVEETLVIEFELVETTCVKGKDETKLMSSDPYACPKKVPEVESECKMNVIRQKDKSQKFSLQCSQPEVDDD